MKQLIIVSPGTLDASTKQRLAKNNVILIEHENPESVRMVNATTDMYTNDIMISALKAAMEGIEGDKFLRELYKRVTEKEKQ